MSDLLRMTGMYSGMDTESIVSQLVKTKSTKEADRMAGLKLQDLQYVQ